MLRLLIPCWLHLVVLHFSSFIIIFLYVRAARDRFARRLLRMGIKRLNFCVCCTELRSDDSMLDLESEIPIITPTSAIDSTRKK